MKHGQTTSFEFYRQTQEENNDVADFVDIENKPLPDKLELYFGPACKFPASDTVQLLTIPAEKLQNKSEWGKEMVVAFSTYQL